LNVYIAGPITGIHNDNWERFSQVASKLEAMGHQVTNPHDLVKDHPGIGWADAMRICLRGLLECEAICLLERWERSRGTRLEMCVAQDLGFSFLHAEDLDK
jgi:hypothetical protein